MAQIKIRITKTARRICGSYGDVGSCLLATALKRTKRFRNVLAGYDVVRLNGLYYNFSEANAMRIHSAYGKSKQAFEPFNITLRRVPLERINL